MENLTKELEFLKAELQRGRDAYRAAREALVSTARRNWVGKCASVCHQGHYFNARVTGISLDDHVCLDCFPYTSFDIEAVIGIWEGNPSVRRRGS